MKYKEKLNELDNLSPVKNLASINEDLNENNTNQRFGKQDAVVDFNKLSNLQDESLKIDFHPC